MAKHKDRRGEVLELWLEQLPRERRFDVEALVEVLMADMQGKIAAEGIKARGLNSFGKRMALEVIWSLGRWMNEPLARRLGEEYQQ